LEAEVKKGEKGDKFVKQTYARQVVQSEKNKEKYMENKVKI
jgi:charged multivesicular body protein 3